MKYEFKRLIAFLMVAFMICNICNISQEPARAGGRGEYLATDSDAGMELEETVDIPAFLDIDAVSFYVTPTDYAPSDYVNIASGREWMHGLKGGTEQVDVYCIQPAKSTPNPNTAYREIAYGTSGNNMYVKQEVQAMAVLKYAYGGWINKSSEAGGSYGTYLINGKPKNGLMINGAFYEMTSGEAWAVTALVIRYLNMRKGIDVDEGLPTKSVTGTGNDANIKAAANELYLIGKRAGEQYGSNPIGMVEYLDSADTCPKVKMTYQIKKSDGSWATLPNDYDDWTLEEWQEYIRYGNIFFRINYEAYNMMPDYYKYSFPTGADGKVLYSHEAEAAECYDFIKITEEAGNTTPIQVKYGAPSTETKTFKKVFKEDETVAGCVFKQSVEVGMDAGFVFDDERKLAFRVSNAGGQSTTPASWSDGNQDGIFNYGARFFETAPEYVGVQNVAFSSPANIIDATSKAFSLNPEVPGRFGLKIVKRSAEQSLTNNNSSYSLENSLFRLYGSADGARAGKASVPGANETDAIAVYPGAENEYDIIPEIELDANGNQVARALLIDNLEPGTYYLKELIAPKGFCLNSQVGSDSDYYDSNDIYKIIIDGNEHEYTGNKACAMSYKASTKNYTVLVRNVPKKAGIMLDKQYEDTSISADDTAYSLEGAKFVVFSDLKAANNSRTLLSAGKTYDQIVNSSDIKSSISGVIVTDTDGYGSISNLPLGIYYVVELLASKGCKVSPITDDSGKGSTYVKMVKLTDGKTVYNSVKLLVKEKSQKGEIHITKTSRKERVTDGCESYSLEGAYFALFKGGDEGEDSGYKSAAECLTDAQTNRFSSAEFADIVERKYADSLYKVLDPTDEAGVTALKNIPFGKYYLLEIAPSKNYLIGELEDSDGKGYIREIVIEDGGSNEFTYTVAEPPKTGSIKLHKKSADEGVTKNNDYYELGGAVYGVFQTREQAKEATEKDYAATNKDDKTGWIVTDKNGEGIVKDLPVGVELYIKEVKAPKGYALDEKIYTAKISEKEYEIPVELDLKDYPQMNPVELLVNKLDADSRVPVKGALFSVKYYKKNTLFSGGEDPDKKSVRPERTWVFASDEKGKVCLDKEHFVTGDSFYTNAGNKGEISFPLGVVTIQEIKCPVEYHLDKTVYVFDIKGDASGSRTVKVFNSMTAENAPIKQRIQLMKLGENKSGDNPLPLAGAGFKACPVTELKKDAKGNYIWDESKAVPFADDGLDSGEDTEITAEDYELFTDDTGYAKSRRMRYGTYLVRETTVPENFEPIEDFLITINDDTYPVQELRYCLDNVFGAYLKVVKKDAETDKCILNNSAMFKIWSYEENRYVSMQNGSSGMTDKFSTNTEGILITPDKLPVGKYRLEEIQNPKGYYSEKGKDSVDFEVVKKGVFEPYYDAEGNETAAVLMTVFCYNTPYKGMLKINKSLVTYDKKMAADRKISWEEKKTSLQDIEFGIYAAEDILSADGQGTLLFPKDVMLEKISTDENGYAQTGDELPLGKYYIKELKYPGKVVPMEDEIFTISSENEYVDISLYGDLTKKVLVSELELINHEKPKIKTSAFEQSGKTRTVEAAGELTIVDTVEYKNLVPGKEYTLEAVLMDKNTKKSFEVNKHSVTATKTFIPKEACGYAEVLLTFDSGYLTETTDLVVFETLRCEDKTVATHRDIDDDNQTVRVTFKKKKPLVSAKKPEDTNPGTPKTGDNTKALAVIGIMLLAVAGVVVLLKRKKKMK